MTKNYNKYEERRLDDIKKHLFMRMRNKTLCILFLECPRSKDRMERFACPTPDFRSRYVSTMKIHKQNSNYSRKYDIFMVFSYYKIHFDRYRCIDDRSLCDGFFDCPGQEDENPEQCLFYKTVRNVINF